MNISAKIVYKLSLALFSYVLMISFVQATTLTVINSSEEINGNTLTPEALVSDPGPDGISLPEAINAANTSPGPHTINFDNKLKGATIFLTKDLQSLKTDQILLTGDTDKDGESDITLDGTNSVNIGFHVCSSDVTIQGFKIINFNSSGILVLADSGSGIHTLERITILENIITTRWSGIKAITSGTGSTIRDMDIVRNRLSDNMFEGIGIDGGLEPSDGSNNRIENVRIIGNSILNGNKLAIFATGAGSQGYENNLISDIIIQDNTILGHLVDTSILITAGNGSRSKNNRVENLAIKGNVLDGRPVLIELVGGVEYDSTGNIINNVSITDNTVRQGGIMLVGGSLNASFNSISSVLIARNRILDAINQGFQIQGGSFGANNNTVENVTILSNLISKSAECGVGLLGGFDASSNNVIDCIYIRNNTIVENGISSWGGGININNDNNSTGNTISAVHVSNTILWGNNYNDSINGPPYPETVKYSIVGNSIYNGSDGTFYADPLFVDPANMDYSLQNRSPALDSGDPSGEGIGEMDLNGNPRRWDGDGDCIAVVDIGAIEYNTKKEMGDINCDKEVNLIDAIVALQVLSGSAQATICSNYISSPSDVDCDNRIGMPEVLIILQKICGLR